MADTGERREITSRANAKEAETVQRSKKLLSKIERSFASESNQDSHTARPPALASRKDMRQAVRNVRRAREK